MLGLFWGDTGRDGHSRCPSHPSSTPPQPTSRSLWKQPLTFPARHIAPGMEMTARWAGRAAHACDGRAPASTSLQTSTCLLVGLSPAQLGHRSQSNLLITAKFALQFPLGKDGRARKIIAFTFFLALLLARDLTLQRVHALSTAFLGTLDLARAQEPQRALSLPGELLTLAGVTTVQI